MLKKIKLLFSVFVSISIFLIPIVFQFIFKLDSDVLNNDYSDIHLGHALGLDFWIRGIVQQRDGYFAITHPGLLFQISSWLVYFFINVSTWFSSTGFDLAEFTLSNSYNFFFFSAISSSLLLLTFTFWTAHKLKFVILIPLFGILYGITGEYTHTIIHFTNDYFAIPLILIWFLIWKHTKNPLDSFQFYFTMGALSSIVYLNKLPYIVWILAFEITLICFAIVKKKMVIYIGIIFYTITFIAATFSLSVFFFGWDGFMYMLSSHKSLFINSGRMGEGSHTFIEFSLLISNFKLFLTSNNIFSTITILLLFLYILYRVLLRKLFNGYGLINIISKIDPFVFWGLVAFIGGFLATMKHYGYNYLFVALCPLIIVSIVVYTKRNYFVYLFFMGMIIVSILFNVAFNVRFFRFNSFASENLKYTYDVLSTENPKAVFVTEYRNPSKQFTSYHVLFCSDLPQKEEIYSKIFPNSYVYYFEDPNFFFGSQKFTKEELKWTYWVSVYKLNDLDWYSQDRSNYLSNHSIILNRPSRDYISTFKRTK